MLEQDNELIVRFKAGDNKAFAELYERYVQYAFGTALLLLKDTSVAADACQDAFVKVYLNIHKFKDGNQFKPWFYRILVNEAMRLTRRAMRWPRTVGEIPDIPSSFLDIPEYIIINKEQEYELRQAVNKLPAKLRVPIVLRYYADLTEEEIAETLNIPLGTAKSRLNRGRKRLEIILQEYKISLGGIDHA